MACSNIRIMNMQRRVLVSVEDNGLLLLYSYRIL